VYLKRSSRYASKFTVIAVLYLRAGNTRSVHEHGYRPA
jgi:hypothetical protein